MFKLVGATIEASDNLQSFSTHALANIVWAYASSNIPYPNIFKKAEEIIVDIIRSNNADASDLLDAFKPQALSIILWAYAAANVQRPRLFKTIGAEIVHKDILESFKPQELSNIVWALATAKVKYPEVFQKVGDVALDSLDQFRPQNLSNLLWAYSTAKIRHPGLFKKVGDSIALLHNLEGFKPQEITNILWAFANSNIYHPGMFKKIGDVIVESEDLSLFSPQALSNTVWAFATLNECRPDLFKKIASVIIERDVLKLFNSQELANIAWSYAVANVDTPSLFNQSFRRRIIDVHLDWINADMCQLHQWYFWQTELGQPEPDSWVSKKLRQRLRNAFSDADVNPSALQRDVFSELVSIGLDPVEEYIADSGYSLDALVEINGDKIGIEVDGPFHFIDRRRNGSTVLKHRQVTSIDKIPLVSVPYWEWQNLGDDRIAKQQYLQALLSSCAPNKVSTTTLKNDRKAPDAMATSSFDASSENHVSTEQYNTLKSLTVHHLKEILRSKGLKVSGRKSELVERFLQSIS
jgi:hypothetical protein